MANGYIWKMTNEEITDLDYSVSTMAHYLLSHPVGNPKKPRKVRHTMLPQNSRGNASMISYPVAHTC